MRAVVYLLILVIGISSCKKDDEPLGTDWEEGVIYFTGAPEVDGCGWLLLVDGESYHIQNLGEDFKVDNLDVWFKADDVDETFSCGLGQTEFATLKLDEIVAKPWEVRFLSDYPKYDKSFDNFSLDTAFIEGDSLKMYIGYGGGCAIHQFNLWALDNGEAGDENLHLMLEHIGNGDMCEAYLHEWLAFSLIPIREDGQNEVKFGLRGSPYMSIMMVGEFVYKY